MIGIRAASDIRRRSVSHWSPGAYTIDGDITVVSSAESITARSASAFERKKRVRELGVAPIAPKNRNRSTPAASAWRSRRAVARPFNSSMLPAGWSRMRGRQMDDRPHAPHRLAQRDRVRQVPERDLHPDAVRAQAAGIAHQAP